MVLIKLLLLFLSSTMAFVPNGDSVNNRRNQVRMAAVATKNVKSLIQANRAKLDDLASIAPEMSEIARLRFVLAFPERSEARRALREAVVYRNGEGKSMVEAAAKAVAAATAIEGSWSNDVVRESAPNAAAINRFISPKNILSLSTEDGDIIYVIRASLIDDRRLMSRVSVNQMSDFFLYVKEVHNLVLNARSERTGRLCEVIFANDISGVRAIPDPRFSKALTQSSQQYERLYPSLAGPTMILNLPFVLQAFIGLIKPLFPRTVQDRLAFKSAPVLARQKELSSLTTNSNTRKSFISEINRLLR